MPGEVKLKPCPFCGKQPLHTVLRPRASIEIHRYECDCGFSRTAYTNSEEKAATFWNLRTPEPGTSVIRWTRYDGTPETLPCTWTEKEGAQFVLLKRKNRDVCQDHLVATQSTYSFYEWYSCSREPEIGDLWACLPEPPEGME